MVFFLYIPNLPSLRAQFVQTIYSAHALATIGRQVTLCYRGDGDPLDAYGLSPHPNLSLVRLPSGRTAGSLAFRGHFLRWRRGGGIAIARQKRYARFAQRLGVPVVIEAHEVDSLQAPERGEDPAPHRALEDAAFPDAVGVICNCEGVAARLAHYGRPTLVAHNASIPGPDSVPSGRGIAYAGSLIPGKDLETLARTGLPVTLFGDHTEERFGELQAFSGKLVSGGGVAPRDLLARLREFRVLVLPLGAGLFGRELTSPLKAFAYQAARVPFVGADTPALHRAAPGAFAPYQPGDPADLTRAIGAVDEDDGLRRRLLDSATIRTWAQRAREIDTFLGTL